MACLRRITYHTHSHVSTKFAAVVPHTFRSALSTTRKLNITGRRWDATLASAGVDHLKAKRSSGSFLKNVVLTINACEQSRDLFRLVDQHASDLMPQIAASKEHGGANSNISPWHTHRVFIISSVFCKLSAFGWKANVSEHADKLVFQLLRSFHHELAMQTASSANVLDARLICATVYALWRIFPTKLRETEKILYDIVNTLISSPNLQEFLATNTEQDGLRSIAMLAFASASHGIKYQMKSQLYNTLLHAALKLSRPPNDANEIAMLLSGLTKAGMPVNSNMTALLRQMLPLLPVCNQMSMLAVVKAVAALHATSTSPMHAVDPEVWTTVIDELAIRAHTWAHRGAAMSKQKDAGVRATAFSPDTIAAIVHTLATHNIKAPNLMAGLTKYLTRVSVTSDTDDGGANGFKASESLHAAGDVAIISTYNTHDLVRIMWSIAKLEFHDDRTPALWQAAGATMLARTTAGTQKTPTMNPQTGSSNNSDRDTRNEQLQVAQAAAYCWAATRSSVASQPLISLLLDQCTHVKQPNNIFAQLLWSAAVQAVVEPSAFQRSLKHILADAAACEAMDRRTASQLHVAFAGLHIRSGVRFAIPANTRKMWQHACLAERPTPSRLQHAIAQFIGDRVPCHHEFVLPEGFIVDVYIPSRKTVVEVQGPSHYIQTLNGCGQAAATQLRLSDATPTMATKAKIDWLSASGYTVVPISWLDWRRAVSTQERLQLLAENGLQLD